MLRQILFWNQQRETNALNAGKVLVNLLTLGEAVPILTANAPRVIEKCRSASQYLFVSVESVLDLDLDFIADEIELPFCLVSDFV